MKSRKNVILGLLVTAIAVGVSYSSYSESKNPPTTYYVVATANGTTWTCQPVTVDPAICDQAAGQVCRIQIQTIVSPGSKNVIAHPDVNSCANTLTDSSPLNGGPYPLDNFNARDAKDTF